MKQSQTIIANEQSVLNCSIDSSGFDASSSKLFPDIKNRLKFDPSSSLIGESTINDETTLLVKDDDADWNTTNKSPFVQK